MEEKDLPNETNSIATKTSKCHHLAAIIILAILLAGSLGFGIFELVQNLQKTGTNCEVAANDKRSSNNTKPKNTGGNPAVNKPVVNDAGGNPVVNDAGGSVTINIAVNYDIIEVKKCSDELCLDGAGYFNFALGDDLYANYIGGENIISYYSDGLFSGVVFDKKVEKDFKLDGKLKQALVGRFGNGGDSAIILLTNDGKVAAVHLNETADDITMTKNLGNLSNIVSLRIGVNGDGGDVFAIDANGKAHELYTTFYQW